MKKSILFFAALAALFSCSKENPVDNYNPADDTYSVTLTASAPGADTKTTLVDGVDDKGKPQKFVHWSKGDAIKVLFFPGRHGNAITGPSGEFVSHFVEDASASANFRIDKWSFGMDQSYVADRLYSKGIAVYPYSANATSTKAEGKYTNNVSDVSFTLPSEQNAVENNIESNLNFSYADVDLASFTNTINNPSHQTKLTFNNTCALIQLTMPAELPKVTQIAITSNDKVALTGHGSMNYTTAYNQEVNGTVTITDGANVVLKNADGFKAGAAYYAVVWPGVHNSGLTIEFKAEDGTVATKTTPSVTLKASMVKPYTFNNGLDFIAPVQDFNYIYDDGTLGNEVKNKIIIGVVIYNGAPQDIDSGIPSKYSKGLAVYVDQYSTQWQSSAQIATSDLTAAGVALANSTSKSSVGGFTAMSNLIMLKSSYLKLYSNMPLFSYSFATVLYVGTTKEWDIIAGDMERINSLLSAAGKTQISGQQWTANAASKFNSYYTTGNGAYSSANATWTLATRPIFAF